ncbi:MAG: DUF2585 family protein [Acidobacteriota bacterium]|nr:MAG: DUF2585 family protein [Acidobacteriota bacterium]
MSETSDNKNGFFSEVGHIPIAVTVVIFIATGITLAVMGRVIWCKEGDPAPWSWDIWTTHNSQHLVDPYAFTHVLHGILEFWLIGLVFYFLPLGWRFSLAILIESIWEVAENSPAIIERYRTVTLSLDYFGDSVMNSLADIVACALGFWIAFKIGFVRSLLLFLATEAFLIAWIRDSLILNIIMLLYPLEAIKAWQMGGQ